MAAVALAVTGLGLGLQRAVSRETSDDALRLSPGTDIAVALRSPPASGGRRFRACGACARARRRRARGRRPSPPVSIRVGRSLEPRLGEEDREPALADLALAEVRVAVAVAAKRGLRVVQVQAGQPLEARPWRRTRRPPPSSASGVRISNPEASRWHESRQMPTRGSPSRRSTSPASSSKFRPSGPWVPAVFSSSTGQLSESARAARDRLRGPLHRRRRAARPCGLRRAGRRRGRRSRRRRAARG